MPTLPSAWLGLISAGSSDLGGVEALRPARDRSRAAPGCPAPRPPAARSACRSRAPCRPASHRCRGCPAARAAPERAAPGVATLRKPVSQKFSTRSGGSPAKRSSSLAWSSKTSRANRFSPCERRAHRRVGRLVLLVVAMPALGEIGQPRIAGKHAKLQHARGPEQQPANSGGKTGPALASTRSPRPRVARTAGLEPATSCSGGKRSIRLSYARVEPSIAQDARQQRRTRMVAMAAAPQRCGYHARNSKIILTIFAL